MNLSREEAKRSYGIPKVRYPSQLCFKDSYEVEHDEPVSTESSTFLPVHQLNFDGVGAQSRCVEVVTYERIW
ncbi:MAG: hypothetical protein ACYS22_16880 [Planctomycetota bacterium]